MKLRQRITASLLIIILALAAAAGVYIWKQHRVSDLQNENQQLKSQVSSLRYSSGQLSQQIQSLKNQAAAGGTQPSGNNFTYQSAKGVKILVYSPAGSSTVASPVAVIGQVPGGWSFEAQFPVKLTDSTGKVIAQSTAHVLGAWTTSQLVPFSAQLTFSSKPSGNGFLVLEKDNPSGLSSNQDSLSLPVKF